MNGADQSSLERTLAVRVTGFVSTLRVNGFKVGIREETDALKVAASVGIMQREPLRHSWRALLCGRGDDWRRFDELFESYWMPPNKRALVESRASGANQIEFKQGDIGGQSDAGQALASAGSDGDAQGESSREGASPRESLMEADFQYLNTPEESRTIEALVREFARRLKRLVTRREWSAPQGTRIDMRKTVRKSLSAGGNPWHPVRRVRRKVRPRLVLLLDVSRSMSLYSFFYLRLARALVGELADVHVFLYHTHLTHVSEALNDPDPWRAQERLQLLSAGWAGGTRIGECLQKFNEGYGSRLVHSRTVVLIASDGFDAGEPGLLGRQMAALAGRARRIVWMNPLKSHPGYEPKARGMQEALPHVDLFMPGHNLASFEAIVPLLQQVMR